MCAGGINVFTGLQQFLTFLLHIFTVLTYRWVKIMNDIISISVKAFELSLFVLMSNVIPFLSLDIELINEYLNVYLIFDFATEYFSHLIISSLL